MEWKKFLLYYFSYWHCHFVMVDVYVNAMVTCLAMLWVSMHVIAAMTVAIVF